MISKCGFEFRTCEVISETNCIFVINFVRDLIESRNKSMFEPINKNFRDKDENTMRKKEVKLINSPLVFFECLKNYDPKKN